MIYSPCSALLSRRMKTVAWGKLASRKCRGRQTKVCKSISGLVSGEVGQKLQLFQKGYFNFPPCEMVSADQCDFQNQAVSLTLAELHDSNCCNASTDLHMPGSGKCQISLDSNESSGLMWRKKLSKFCKNAGN